MTLREFTLILYFLPGIGFAIASVCFFEQMRRYVNEKRVEAERLTFWKIVSKQVPYTDVATLYRRYYPNGNLATLSWVCCGFGVLYMAGGIFCVSIATRQ